MTVHASSSYSHPHTRTHALHMPLFLAVKFQRGCSALFPSLAFLSHPFVRNVSCWVHIHTQPPNEHPQTPSMYTHSTHASMYRVCVCFRWTRNGGGKVKGCLVTGGGGGGRRGRGGDTHTRTHMRAQ